MSISSILLQNIKSTNKHIPFLGTNVNNAWKWNTRQDIYNSVIYSREQLQNWNVKKGDRVAFKGKNSFEWITWNLATNSLGCVWVPMYHDQNTDYCNYIIQDCNPKIFLTDDMNIDVNIDKSPINVDNTYNPSSKIDYVDHSIATLIYTSGTTGSPKGVMLSNENIISNVNTIRTRFYDLPSSTCLNILPWAHIYSQTCELYYNMLYNNTIALSTSREDFIQQCRQIQPNILYLVPRVLELVKNKVSRFENTLMLQFAIPYILKYLFGQKLKYIFTGGAKLNDETKYFYLKYGYHICEGYGCTETSPMISVNHFNSPRDVCSIGKVLDGIQVEIINGEIQVSGPNVMLGYWNNQEATSSVLEERNGTTWYKTGDSGSIKDGFLYYDGRKSENYKLSNGKFVNVQDVEQKMKTILSGNVVVFGENQLYNDIIVTEQISNHDLNKINEMLDSYLRIDKVHVISNDEFSSFLTPKMSIKRKQLIEYIKMKKI